MAGFRETLERVAGRVPEASVVMIMAIDGIPVERVIVRPVAELETVAAEYTSLLRASMSAAADTGLGELNELTIGTERMTALLVGITHEYVLFAALDPHAIVGRARYYLRQAGVALRSEFQ